MREHLRFLLGHEVREITAIDPTMTVLDWLRGAERRTGTNEGCNEGDCGACTVVVGRLDGDRQHRTHAPSTYKIPTVSDRPADMRIRIVEGAANREETVFRSKAVSEPPLMLAISVLHALSDAIASTAAHRLCPRLDAPATPERVLMTIERLRARARDSDAPKAAG